MRLVIQCISGFTKGLYASPTPCLQCGKMSDKKKRSPISIYLSPRAAIVLNQYSMGSGYGSVSRTVEEIILAFDFTYNTIKEALKFLKSQTTDSKGELTKAGKAAFFMYIILVLSNTDNAISRLNKAEPLLQK